MAKTTTTLAGAIGPSDWLVNTANNAAMKPNDNIVIGTETMRALVVDPNVGAIVYRGARGTAGQAAAGGATVNYGPPTDWGVGGGYTRIAEPFEREARDEIALEDAEKLDERVEKKRKDLAAADAKATADAKAAADKAEAAADKAEKAADKAAQSPTHR